MDRFRRLKLPVYVRAGAPNSSRGIFVVCGKFPREYIYGEFLGEEYCIETRPPARIARYFAENEKMRNEI